MPADNGISITTGSAATSITDSFNTDTVTVNATALANNTALTLTGSAAEVVTGLIGNITAGSTGALTVMTGDATDNTIAITTGSAATWITDSFNTDTVTVTATALADNVALTLAGSAAETVTGLQGDLTATGVSGAFDEQSRLLCGTVDCNRQRIEHDYSDRADRADVEPAAGGRAATVTLNAGASSGNLAAGTYTGNI